MKTETLLLNGFHSDRLYYQVNNTFVFSDIYCPPSSRGKVQPIVLRLI